MNPKSYDPTVAFMFFREWVEAIDELERVTDKHRMFKAIADYSMYGEEPDFSDSATMRGMWRLLVGGIDASVRNRQKGFAKDELNENYVKVKEALQQNTMASLREIAEVTGVSKSTVERVKRKLERAGTFTSAPVLTPASIPTPVPVPAIAPVLTPTSNPNPAPNPNPTYSPNPSYSMGRDSGTVSTHTEEGGHSEEVTNDAVPSLDSKIDEDAGQVKSGYDPESINQWKREVVLKILQNDPDVQPWQIAQETGISDDFVCKVIDEVECMEFDVSENDTDDISDEDLPF